MILAFEIKVYPAMSHSYFLDFVPYECIDKKIVFSMPIKPDYCSRIQLVSEALLFFGGLSVFPLQII